MKSRLNKILVFLILQLVCIFAFTACGSPHIMDSLNRHNVDYQLWNDYEIVCDIKGETFTGRAHCYGVILFEDEPTAFLQSFSTDKSDGFSSEKNEKLEQKIDYHSSGLKIPNEYYPNWDDEYLWYVSGGFDKLYYLDTLFMIYFPHEFKLVIFETGH